MLNRRQHFCALIHVEGEDGMNIESSDFKPNLTNILYFTMQ